MSLNVSLLVDMIIVGMLEVFMCTYWEGWSLLRIVFYFWIFGNFLCDFFSWFLITFGNSSVNIGNKIRFLKVWVWD